MKNISYFIIGTLAFTFFGMTACHKYEAVDVEQMYVSEDAAWTKTHTVAEFLNTYMTEFGTPSPSGNTLKYPPRARSYEGAVKTGANLGLFSVDDIPDSVPVVIIGRIVSQDVAGNVYKTMYIQDCEHPEQGLKLSVDAGSLSGMFSIGQKIAINCAGLAVGKYAKMPQIGVPYFNNAKEGQDIPQKVGWEIGRIPLPIFKAHVQLVGAPDPSKIVANKITIEEVKATTDNFRDVSYLASRFVELEGVSNSLYFTQEGFEYGSPVALEEVDCIFAPTTNGIGYPQSRIVKNSSGTWMSVGTSEYAKFADAKLPPIEYKGKLYGFISYYHDNGQNAPSNQWTIVLRSLDDVQLSNGVQNWRADECFYPKY